MTQQTVPPAPTAAVPRQEARSVVVQVLVSDGTATVGGRSWTVDAGTAR